MNAKRDPNALKITDVRLTMKKRKLRLSDFREGRGKRKVGM